MLKFLTFLSLLFAFQVSSQLKLEVKVVDFEQNKSVLPKTFNINQSMIAHKGYVLEFTLTNTSDQPVSFPLDTLSYAIPFTEDTRVYYEEENVSSNPDRLYRLGVYGFIDQNGPVSEGGIGCEMPDIVENPDHKKAREEREKTISKWERKNHFKTQGLMVNNWYIMKSMVVMKPEERIQYKIYFNPFFKKLCHYCYTEYYDGLNPELPYEVNFKIILNKNLYTLLTEKQKRQYKNLYTEVVTSNTLRFEGQ